MDKLIKIKHKGKTSKVMDSINKVKEVKFYNGEKINYKTLVSSVSSLLNSTSRREKKLDEYNIANSSYRLEVLSRPITDKLTIYKKGKDFDLNLFKIDFFYSVDPRMNKLKLYDENSFFKDTGINKDKLAEDVGKIYFGSK